MRDHVDVIFTKLSLVYGRDFLSRWEGLDLMDVKNDWRHELGGIKEDQIHHALKNLPISKPPNVFEFRQVALNAPRKPALCLPMSQANTELVKKEIDKARQFLKFKD